MESKQHLLQTVREVLSLESDALREMSQLVGEPFARALELLSRCSGKVVLTGVGKSGLIARKIAATLSSTGTVSTFLHPSDGVHGDLGVVTASDVVIALGKSGESEELLKLIPSLKSRHVPIIAITAVEDSRLARSADVVLLMPAVKEACPLDLAPTTSTTVSLAIGDALAVTLMKIKGFKPEDFAVYHPGGKLGKRLLLKVKDLMIPAQEAPLLELSTAKMEDVIFSLTQYGMGIVVFCDASQHIEAILTDGDIRRLLNTHRNRIFDIPLQELVNRKPLTLGSEVKAVEALRFMEERDRPLNVVPILENEQFVGVLRLHELLSVS